MKPRQIQNNVVFTNTLENMGLNELIDRNVSGDMVVNVIN